MTARLIYKPTFDFTQWCSCSSLLKLSSTFFKLDLNRPLMPNTLSISTIIWLTLDLSSSLLFDKLSPMTTRTKSVNFSFENFLMPSKSSRLLSKYASKLKSTCLLNTSVSFTLKLVINLFRSEKDLTDGATDELDERADMLEDELERVFWAWTRECEGLEANESGTKFVFVSSLPFLFRSVWDEQLDGAEDKSSDSSW
ncbi:hypothetical protein BpHYR1_033164 [Brachionus plicatilis]|uniref:Uncharacterized protein n=1 Tax=Brachionus plicatilis TaxID=10195 RepID=A0A3M7QME8_BRAPC|nr:hypothetical protein BpHYR1_033164 [Brachionus plicatilis]